MEIVQCSGTFTLRFENLKKEAELIDTLAFAFNTEKMRPDYKHMALFDTLYHATEGSCSLMHTFTVETRGRVRFTLGREGYYDHRRIVRILSMIAPYTVSGEIVIYNENLNYRYVFSRDEEWVFETGKVVYKQKAILFPAKSVA